MNRIYQGRVTRVEILQDKKSPPKPLEDWQSALWLHHHIFQDAVNYYIVALASLADPEHSTNRLIKDLRVRVDAAWDKFPRPVSGEAISLRQSVAKWLRLSDAALLGEAFDAVLAGNDAPANIRTLALALLLSRCSGDSAIQQGGRGYFPKFCDATSRSTYEYSGSSQKAAEGKRRLAQALHGTLPEGDLNDLARELDLSWTVKVQPGKYYTPEESSTRLLEALNHLSALIAESRSARIKEIKDHYPNCQSQLDGFKTEVENATRECVIPRNRKASKDVTFATLAFKYFPCPLTAKILSLFVAKPTASIGQATDEMEFARHGEDPIKLARGRRGFVFRAFTALPDWNPVSPGEPVWKEFDIAAFKEALKALNQFNQQTQDRIETENDLRGQLAIMLGSNIKGWKPRKSEAGDDEPIPDRLDPRLFELAKDLERNLTEDIADTVVGSEQSINFGEAVYSFREGGWLLSSAALRGYRDIAEEWNKLHAKLGDGLTSERLEDEVKKHQRDEKNQKSLGSIPLFLRLCEKKYWPLWLANGDEPEESSGERSFLRAMVSFHLKFRDFQRSLEPINLTPAEPEHSRRLYMFSDLKDKTAKVVFEEADGKYSVACAIAMRTDDGNLRATRVRLHYSAKRLLRDELQGGVESRWLQPITRALGLQKPDAEPGKQFESAVSLMPDYTGLANAVRPRRLRFLLNFPVTIDPAWIHAGLGKSAIWKGQFNGTEDKNLHLHWPGTIKGKGAESPWWKNKQIIEKGFTCTSIDLGQRTAGAWAIIHMTCADPRTNGGGTRRPVRVIGSDGERTWFAEVMRTGILRLPGEDQRVMDGKGNCEVERFGKAGRNSLETEWKQARKLAGDLSASTPEAWVGKTYAEKSFPEQNDALIALANRRLSRLNTFHRWSCFDPDRPEVAERRANLIEKLNGELMHWQDAEVVTWKEMFETGNFAGFRAAAGAGYESLRQELGLHLVTLANRVAPLRNRSWNWDRTKGSHQEGQYGELLDTGAPLATSPTWIRGQRGLSLSRIEQLENLRRLFLRYNRSFDREPGKPAKFGRADLGRRSGEPCRLLLDKIDRMKEQRVNQTAHLILAQALGVRLKPHQTDSDERSTRDIHGEYEPIPGREPVDFIVIENLDRYLTSQGRAPSENSRLMKWAHRAVRGKIKMLAEEPFGIPVVETSAAYSSRFCAVTSVAGARCEERASLTDYLKESLETRASRVPKPGQPSPEDFATLLEQFTQLDKMNVDWQQARDKKRKTGRAAHTLFLPKQGGPLFLAVSRKTRGYKGGRVMPIQADVNAAINIGLRAVAAPDALSVLHKVRTERDGNCFKPMIKNAREKAAFSARPVITMDSTPSEKLTKTSHPNFFFDAKALDCLDTATLTLAHQTISLASGIGLWAAVNAAFVRQLIEINNGRLERWRRDLAEEDNIPM